VPSPPEHINNPLTPVKQSLSNPMHPVDSNPPDPSAGQAMAPAPPREMVISRGDTLLPPPPATPHETTPAESQPHVGRAVEAMLVWMHEKPLIPGRSYLLKHTTRMTGAEVSEIRNKVDVNTLEERPAQVADDEGGMAGGRLDLNEVGRVVIRTTLPLVFDPYRRNHTTGALILIDRLTNATVGAGMILGPATPLEDAGDLGPVSREEKETRLGQKGAILWIPRVDAAEAIERALFERGRTVIRLDLAADELTALQAQTVGRLLARQGLITIITGPADGIAPSSGSEPVLIYPTQDPHQIMRELAAQNILPVEESLAGEGI
ncbi:MAG: hypothetical protein WCI73_06280, partial [Phycisphaerae bacterium]